MTRASWIAFAIVAFVAGSARAGDDGGARSVFAEGAGNRALGLGGAYAAVADDASAVLWNPAGLSLVDRRELQVTQTGYYGLDISEQYASVVYPHWRYGTVSLTFRRFGAGGIEQRDDRNVLLDGDLSSSENELILGYGRSIGSAWGVGGSVKFRRQSLAGFNDSGAGVDIGVYVHPVMLIAPNRPDARRFRVALAVRNAVRPELRLSQERVADPTGVRFGVSGLLPVPGRRTVLAAVDIEKTNRMDTRLHAGLEVAVHPLLRLRAGVNDGSFSAGTGVSWSGVDVDYSMEQNNVEMVHRFGASFHFGPTREASRLAAVDAEERALQEQLDRAFRERQDARVRAMAEDAAKASEEGRHQDALRTLSVVAALAPEYPGILERQVACLDRIAREAEGAGDLGSATLVYSRALALDPNSRIAQEGYDRCRDKSDRIAARTEERRRMFDAAMDAFMSTRLVEARTVFGSILELDPDDQEAVGMLVRTEKAIDRAVDDLLADVIRLTDSGLFDEAGSALRRARGLAPDDPSIARAESRLRDAREKATRTVGKPVDPVDTEPQRKALTPSQLEEAEHLYERAIAAMSRRESDDAIRYLEIVWSMDPTYQRVSDHLKREYLTRGMEFYADGELERAVELWEQALKVDPDDERAKGYLTRARKEASRTREIFGGSR